MKHVMKLSEFFPAPSVHEAWVRNRIPRGEHYDPADDGPEVGIIEREAACRAWDFFDVSRPGDTVEVDGTVWLNVGPAWPSEGEVDTLNHRRE